MSFRVVDLNLDVSFDPAELFVCFEKSVKQLILSGFPSTMKRKDHLVCPSR